MNADGQGSLLAHQFFLILGLYVTATCWVEIRVLIATAWGSATTAWSVTAAWSLVTVIVNVIVIVHVTIQVDGGLTGLHRLEHSSLSAAAGHEVELGILQEVHVFCPLGVCGGYRLIINFDATKIRTFHKTNKFVNSHVRICQLLYHIQN